MARTILTPLQSSFLKLLSRDKSLSKRFYWSGGTALSEVYLQHRYSEDLDFFSEEEFSVIPIQAFFKKHSTKLGTKKIEYRKFLGLNTFFLNTGKEILKVDFSYYPFPRLEKGKKTEGLVLDSLLDIAVNKLQTIVTKPRSRDFIDLYCIVKETGWDILTLIKQARNKFDYFVDSLHIGAYFLQAKELKDYPRLLKPLKEEEWQNFFLDQAKKLGKKVVG